MLTSGKAGDPPPPGQAPPTEVSGEQAHHTEMRATEQGAAGTQMVVRVERGGTTRTSSQEEALRSSSSLASTQLWTPPMRRRGQEEEEGMGAAWARTEVSTGAVVLTIVAVAWAIVLSLRASSPPSAGSLPSIVTMTHRRTRQERAERPGIGIRISTGSRSSSSSGIGIGIGRRPSTERASGHTDARIRQVRGVPGRGGLRLLRLRR
mmetsp:Transcript_7310/g.9022  ORF Transcript_7310/g.9022 Transcript_7310/m.9022 type:complete len:207 (-) Transcript_7310:273-893(-)